VCLGYRGFASRTTTEIVKCSATIEAAREQPGAAQHPVAALTRFPVGDDDRMTDGQALPRAKRSSGAVCFALAT
jgi:hypothetical protein